MTPRHPAIYVRISDDREGEAKGVGRQLQDCRALVHIRDWPTAAEYNDNDTSAWKRGVIRPEFRRLLDDIAAGTVDAVVVYDSDRFYRQPRELEEFFDVCEGAKVTQFAQVTGDVDIGSADGRMMLRVKGAFQAKESDDKSRRIRRKHLEIAESGGVNGGGWRSFGFEADKVTLRESECVTIREVKDRILAGESIRGLCFDLNERGIVTASGGEWKPTPLRRLMMSARISGRREHHGEIVADAVWPAIITPAESDRLRAVLTDPARRKNERVRRYLLSGMLTCGQCGEPLVARPRSDGRRRYVCARRPGSIACGKTAVVSDELEELVVEMVLQRLGGPALTRALDDRRDESEDVIQRAIDEADAQLEELAGLYAQQRISASEWMAARNPIEERLRKARADLAQRTGTTAIEQFIGDGDLRQKWPTLSLSRKRAVLSAVIDHVTIMGAVRGRNRFDPSRVSPTWRI